MKAIRIRQTVFPRRDDPRAASENARMFFPRRRRNPTAARALSVLDLIGRPETRCCALSAREDCADVAIGLGAARE